MSDVPTRYLEDLSVGQRFASGSFPVDEAAIIRFAREFDPQPFHLDAEVAGRSVFHGLIASGWHTAAITMRLLVDGEARIAGGLIGLGGEAQWPNPVRPGDVLHVESEVVEITPSRSRPERGVVRMRTETRNQRGDVVQILDARLWVPRRGKGTT